MAPVSTISSPSAPLLGEPLPVELMNTIWADRDGVHEALATPQDAAGWLGAISGRADLAVPGLRAWAGHPPAGDLGRVHRRLHRLREAARGLAARRTEDPRQIAADSGPVTEAVAVVNELASGSAMLPRLAWPDGAEPSLVHATEDGPGDTAVAELARATIRLFAGSDSARLRACLAPGCVLYFVQSHPRREWCSAACGNRARQARHYRRHHQG